MVIYSKDKDTSAYAIIPKSGAGYKLSSPFSEKTILSEFVKGDSIIGGDFTVYNVLDTNDYYLFGSILLDADEINIVDSNKEELGNIISDFSGTKYVLIYGFVDDFTGEYIILVNGEKISISS